MVEVGWVGVFDAEVVDDEGERDGVCFVTPEGRGAWDWGVPVRCEVGGEAVLGDSTGLFEAWHPFSDFHVDIPFVLDCVEIILYYDLLGNELDGYAHVLEVFEGGAVIEIFYVDRAEAGGGSGDDAVDERFDGGDCCACGGCVAVVGEFVTSNGDADAVRFGFQGADVGDESPVGDFLVLGHGRAGDEEDGVVAGGHSLSHALGEAAEVVGEGADPGGGVGAG